MTRITFAIVRYFGRGRKGVRVVIATPACVKCPKADNVASLDGEHGREIRGIMTVESGGRGFKAMCCHLYLSR
jgi:hypothetical protein